MVVYPELAAQRVVYGGRLYENQPVEMVLSYERGMKDVVEEIAVIF